MLTTASTRSSGAQTCAALGKSGSAKTRNPYRPALICTPATIATSGGGDDVYVGGIHAWNGNEGVLMRNANANAANSQPSSEPKPYACPRTSNVPVCVTTPINPSSSTRPPAPV